jgi:hypothetical protein
MPAERASVEMNASSNSLVEVVENDGEVMLVPEVDRSVDFTTSRAMPLQAGVVATKKRKIPRMRRIQCPTGVTL